MLKKWLENKERNSLIAKADKLNDKNVKSKITAILDELENLQNNFLFLKNIYH